MRLAFCDEDQQLQLVHCCVRTFGTLARTAENLWGVLRQRKLTEQYLVMQWLYNQRNDQFIFNVSFRVIGN